MQATDGKGVDVIVEMLANVNLGHDLKMLAHRGTVAVVGSRGDVQITPRDLMSREASIVGVMCKSSHNFSPCRLFFCPAVVKLLVYT